MEKEVVKNHHPHNNITTTTSLRERHVIGQSPDFVLLWGNRKRLRCMKFQVKNDSSPLTRTTVRVDRRVVVKSDGTGNHPTNAHFNLRQRPASPAQPPFPILRNSGGGSGMKHHHHHHGSNGGGTRGLASPDRENKCWDMMMKGGGGRTASSSEIKGGGGGGSDFVWPPKFMISLTNKEKEEDFLAIKGSKLPQRPKKRAKLIQRTLNLVSPGGWLCDLTLERYEVREKKITKKRPRGLKAMGNYLDSDSD